MRQTDDAGVRSEWKRCNALPPSTGQGYLVIITASYQKLEKSFSGPPRSLDQTAAKLATCDS